MENEVVEIYLDDIIPNRFQPREVFNDQALKELAISIREHGVIQPIIVRKFGDKYEIIAGERRYKASTMAGLTKIPAIVRNLDDKESSKVALIENLQRRDLTPIEEARTYQKILDLDEMTQEQLAKTMGKSQSSVSNKLRLLSLPDEVQEALLKEEISERHARSLLNLNDRNAQIELLKQIINNKMTVRELDSKIKEINGSVESSNSNEKINVENEGNMDNNMNDNMNNTINNSNTEQNSDLFGMANMNNVENSNEPESLFGDTDSSAQANDLFGTSLDNGNMVNQNNNIEEVSGNNENNGLFENDPTTVDINKIREQSTDIGPNVQQTQEKPTSDINNLLKPEGQNINFSNRFVPDTNDNTIEKTEDGNEVIGDGLLAGMPVIQPTEEQTEIDSNNNSDSLFGQNDNSNPNVVENNDQSDMMSSNNEQTNNESLFGNNAINTDPLNSMDNSNSLFSTPQVDNIQEENINNENSNSNNNNLFENNGLNEQRNPQEAVNDVKNVIRTYQDKGYSISVEELNLDGEIQLIVKFNKN